MKLTKRNKIIAEFIPVFLLIGYYLFPFQFLQFTQTVLGKTALIGIIVFYAAFVDRLIGAAAALFFIFYYQTDFVENFYSSYAEDVDASTVAVSAQIENFEPATTENLYDDITNNKIDAEFELVMPKHTRNIDISRGGGGDSNPIGTPGVISEAFVPY